MILRVTKPFVGLGFNMPAPGTVIDVDDDVAEQLLGMRVAARYEQKILPMPEVLKSEPKKKVLPSSPVARPAPKKTRRSWRELLTRRLR